MKPQTEPSPKVAVQVALTTLKEIWLQQTLVRRTLKPLIYDKAV